MAFTLYALFSRGGRLIRHKIIEDELLILMERLDEYAYRDEALALVIETTVDGNGELTLAEPDGTTIAEIPLRDELEVQVIGSAVAAAIRASQDPLVRSITVTPGTRHRSLYADTH